MLHSPEEGLGVFHTCGSLLRDGPDTQERMGEEGLLSVDRWAPVRETAGLWPWG